MNETKRARDWQAGRADGEARAEALLNGAPWKDGEMHDVMTHTETPPAGSSGMYKSAWRLGFANVRNRCANA